MRFMVPVFRFDPGWLHAPHLMAALWLRARMPTLTESASFLCLLAGLLLITGLPTMGQANFFS